MRSIVVISSLICVLIIGGLALTSQHIAATLNRNAVEASGGGTLAPTLGNQTDATRGVMSASGTGTDGSEPTDQTAADLLVLRQTLAVQQLTLQAAQRELVATVAALDTAQERFQVVSERNVRKLAKVYEAMKPAKAAPILATLEPDIVLQIMRNMQERQAARILAQMDAELAASISAAMSGQGES